MRLLPEAEIIGDPDCPIMHRWTLLELGRRVEEAEAEARGVSPGRSGLKLLLHRFPAYADDRHLHDHPRPFLTFVISGGYIDEMPGRIEKLTRGAIRYRPARHLHRTRAGSGGAVTLVVMGPLQRPWGFMTERGWIPWRLYGKLYPNHVRCP